MRGARRRMRDAEDGRMKKVRRGGREQEASERMMVALFFSMAASAKSAGLSSVARGKPTSRASREWANLCCFSVSGPGWGRVAPRLLSFVPVGIDKDPCRWFPLSGIRAVPLNTLGVLLSRVSSCCLCLCGYGFFARVEHAQVLSSMVCRNVKRGGTNHACHALCEDVCTSCHF